MFIGLFVSTVSAAAPATGNSDPLASGVLVSDAGPRTLTPGWPRGLWHLTPSGELTKLVGRKWRAETWHPNSGAVVRPRRFSDDRPFDYAVLLDGQFTPLKARAKRLSCASWSADGELLSYLTGEQRNVAPQAWGIEGKLWVADRDSLDQPLAVAEGLFPECPAWSPVDPSLAYLIQGPLDDLWEMRLFDGSASETLHRFNIESPSVSGPVTNQTFDFSSDGRLFFLGSNDIYVRSPQGVTGFGPPAVLEEMNDPDATDWTGYVRSLRVSPNGRLVAVTANWYKSGIVDDDELLRVVRNRFLAWSGDVGVLTFGARDGGRLAVELFPVDPQGKTLEMPDTARKQLIHSDADGEWFAHADSEGRGRIFFYYPDGSRLSVGDPGFNASIVATTSGDIVDRTVGL